MFKKFEGADLVINGENVNFENIFEVAFMYRKVSLSEECIIKMDLSRNYIEKRMNDGEVIYGLNTGFGSFSSVIIDDAQVEELQRNLIRSHSTGVGEPFSKEQTRAMMLLRANTLSRGHSGVRTSVVKKVIEFLNADVIPVVPSQGSVGASGDLAPLSHLALALIGEGKVWRGDKKIKITEVLSEKKMTPVVLKAKEGLALINGCQVMTAVGLLEAHKIRDLLCLFDMSGAMSLEGLRGSRSAFDERISASRPHRGEIQSAKNLRMILGESSQIAESHADCDRVQDAYSLRCMPAVHGAVKDCWVNLVKVLETEANSSTDNPLVFVEQNGEGRILSCGNFHGMPVAFALDYMAIALTSLSSIAEQRVSKLVNTHMSHLPPFLTPQGGLNSGHMIVHVVAASLVSENKVLSHPASVDSIPTSADKEDHVSMGTIAARKLQSVVRNCQHVLATELLSATQALDLLSPLKSSTLIESLKSSIRGKVPYAKVDRIFADDLEEIFQMIQSRELLKNNLASLNDLCPK